MVFFSLLPYTTIFDAILPASRVRLLVRCASRVRFYVRQWAQNALLRETPHTECAFT